MDHIILADDTYYTYGAHTSYVCYVCTQSDTEWCTESRVSLDENKYMTLIHENNKYKTYEVLKPRLDEEKKEYGKLKEEEGLIIGIGEKKKAIEIVKEMLAQNSDIDFIVKVTKLSKKGIEKIKKDMK